MIEKHAIIEFLDNQKQTDSNKNKTSISQLASSALKGGNTSAKTGITGSNKESMTVQYNPSSLHFSASTKEKTASEQEGDYMVTTVSAACTITMNVELIFYGNESRDMPLLPQMDLFLTVMKKNWGRAIRFSWADISFEGEVSGIEVIYDMFDRKGNPISSKVKLSIQGKSNDNVLKKAYQKMEKERQNTLAKQQEGE